jgi:hypothetical protein
MLPMQEDNAMAQTQFLQPIPSGAATVVAVPMNVPAELLPAVHSLVAQFCATRGIAPPAFPAAPSPTLPSATRPWRWWHAWPLAATMALFIVPVCTAAGLVVWRYEQLFADLKLDLPPGTRMLIAFTRWVMARFGWAELLAVAILLPNLLAVIFRPTPLELRRCVRVLVGALTVIGAALAMFAMLALTAPTMTLHQFLAPGPGPR